MTIVLIGSINMDMVMRTSRIPLMGETMHGDGFMLSAGGKGANQAVACARMGADTWLIGKVGGDVFGQTLTAGLREYGVKTQWIAAEPNVTTGVAAITVCGGNNSILLAGGANDCVTPDYIRSFKDKLLSASAVMLQLEIPRESVYEAITLVKGKVPIFLNPAPAIPLDDDVLNGIDYFTPNELECSLYTNVPIHTVEDAFTALTILRGKGIRTPIITLGAKGVAYFNGTDNVHRPGRSVHAMDTTAAGDTFSGTLAAMITAGKSLDEAIELAQQAASISVTRMGAQSSIPALDELL